MIDPATTQPDTHPVTEHDAADWDPGASAATAPTCRRCGTQVSRSFHRVFSVNGELRGCRDCLPRSIRFAGAQDADADVADRYDLDAPNKGREAGGVQGQGRNASPQHQRADDADRDVGTPLPK